MPDDLPSYIIVTPVKDEESYLPMMIESVIAQSHRPVEFVIVDDGSSDGTGCIADYYAQRHSWIRTIHCPTRQKRARGAPIVRAFNAGLQSAAAVGEFVVKLDGDLFVPPHYFQWLAATFRDEPKTGIAGGLVLTDYGYRWGWDRVSARTVHGAAKAYRRRCLESIGGLVPAMGWDGIDEFAARARGWDVHVLTELQVLHYKRRGSKQPWLQARWEEGKANHLMGYSRSFLTVRAIYRMMTERPPLFGGLVIAASYWWHQLKQTPRIDDKLAIGQLRVEQRQQLRNLFSWKKGKSLSATTAGPARRIARSSLSCVQQQLRR